MHFKKYLSLTLVFTAIIVGGTVPITTSTVCASSWKKGTPKVLHGTWTDAYKYPKGAMYDQLDITNKHMYESDDAWYNLSYKKIGYHTYKLRGYNGNLKKRVTIHGSVHFINKHHIRTTVLWGKVDLYK